MHPRSMIVQGAPLWHTLDTRHLPVPMEPEGPGSWMREQGSLTLRLRERYGEDFHVELLQQRPGLPFHDEMEQLGLSRGMKAIVREVALKAGNATRILARSVIPEATLLMADTRLQRLGTQPIGEILFSHPELTRHTMEWTLTKLKGQTSSTPIHGRRSLYILEDQYPLLVAEFFLPALLR